MGLVKDLAISAMIRVGGFGAVFIFNIIAARLLQPAGFGLLALYLNLVTVAAAFGRLGLDYEVLHIIARSAGYRKSGNVTWLISRTTLVVFGCSSIACVGAYAYAEWLPPVSAATRYLAIASIILSAIYLHLSFALRGLQAAGFSAAIERAAAPIISLGIVAALAAAGAALTEAHFMVASCLSFLVTSVLGGFLIVALDGWRMKRPDDEGELGHILSLARRSLPLFALSLAGIVINLGGPFIVAHYGTASDVGRFSAAWRVAMVLYFIVLTIESIASPALGRLFGKSDDTGAAVALSRKLMGLSIIATLPAGVMISVFNSYIFKAFGRGFEDAGGLLLWLAAGQLVNATFGPVNALLIGLRRRHISGLLSAVGAAIFVGSGAILCEAFGAVGVCVAFLLASLVSRISAATAVWVITGEVLYPRLPRGL